MVARPFRRARSGQEDIPEGQEWSRDSPRGSGVVGSLSLRVGRPSWRAGIGQEAFPEGREAFLECQEWSGGSP